MRSYVFTDLERKVLKDWLEGKLTLKDVRLQKVLSRVRLFRTLANDVELYLRVRRRLTKSKAAGST
jgi:hypothetical protein